MHLVGIRVERPTNNPMVLLREATGDLRVLPIFVGADVATAIAYGLEGVEVPRPLTHDLMRNLLEELGAHVESVVIKELRDGIYFASINLVLNGARHEVSSRPSDAIALAVRLGTPIYAEEEVLDADGIIVAESDDQDDLVSAFRKFIDDVSPEDFAG